MIYAASAAVAVAASTYFFLGPRGRPLRKSHYATPRRFLLTGCASGMGRRLAATLLRAGHRVCATDRALGALETTAAADGWGAIADGWSTKAKGWSTLVLRALDVTQPQAWSAAFDAMKREWGGVDTVLNFAGLLIPCAAQRVTAAHVDAHLDVMAKGAIFGTVAAARCFADQPEPAHGGGGGHIVNVSSLGAVAPVQGVSLYQAAKAACRTFSLAAAKDLADSGVCVTCLMPDAVATPMADLQLLHDESTMAYSGGILTLDQLERCLLDDVLLARPLERRLGATYVRQWGAAFADNFPSSRAVEWTEADMRRKGRAAQAKECARRLAAGGLPAETAAALTARLEELKPEAEAAARAAQRPSPRKLALLAIALYALALRVATSAGAVDVAAALVGWPAHPSAAGVAAAAAEARGGFGGGVALVTGGTTGVCLEAAASLAEGGYRVMLGARSASRGDAAHRIVGARAALAGRGGSAEVVTLDLASLASVRAAAAAVRARAPALHVLVGCAGIVDPFTAGVTADGIEQTFGTNHLGHFALAGLLKPPLARGARSRLGARVVIVTSEHGHRFAPNPLPPLPPPADVNFGALGIPWGAAYGISKLANLQHAAELARRWRRDGIAAYAAHPGITRTSLGASRGGGVAGALKNAGVWLWWHVLARPVTEAVEAGAASVVHAAVATALPSGAYVLHCREAIPSAAAANATAAKEMWAASVRIVRAHGVRF